MTKECKVRTDATYPYTSFLFNISPFHRRHHSPGGYTALSCKAFLFFTPFPNCFSARFKTYPCSCVKLVRDRMKRMEEIKGLKLLFKGLYWKWFFIILHHYVRLKPQAYCIITLRTKSRKNRGSDA